MTKAVDSGLTTLFLLYFLYYVIMGIGFGGLSGDNYYIFYIFLTIVGLIFVLNSVVTKSKKVFFWTRLIGLLLVPALIYFDLKNSYTFYNSWENIKDIFTYLPAIIFAIYTLYSLVRISVVSRQKSG
jgi:hypothetical protein